MKECDYTPVLDRSGKQIGRKVVAKSGKTYIIGTKLDAGGVAKVFHAHLDEAKPFGKKKEYVFKEYEPKPERMAIHHTIKRNIMRLIHTPLVDSAGNKIPHFVPPLDIIELKSGGFGYIMDKVDTTEYKSVIKILSHNEFYPDAKTMSKFCKEFVEFFKIVHLKGWCYKDINEGNIYINPADGDFWIIDCDNISVPNDKTILGTAGYMAPEVYDTQKPDTKSDYFSIAAFFFRLFIGTYPMSGPGTERYMKAKDLDVGGAAPYIYGENAVFAFHPKDKSNAVYMDTADYAHKVQTQKWNSLPKQIKKCMLQTFVTALPYDKRQLRTNDVQWMNCFNDLERDHLVQCPKCKKYSFDNRKTCYKCGKPLPVKNKREDENKKKPIPDPNRKNKVTPVPNPKPAISTNEVVFEYKRIVGGKVESGQIAFALNEKVAGNRLHPDFSSTPILYAYYREKEKMYVIHNSSSQAWELARNGKTAMLPVGGDAQINTDLIIKVDKTKYLLKVLGVRKK